jgi:hypothetical protein
VTKDQTYALADAASSVSNYPSVSYPTHARQSLAAQSEDATFSVSKHSPPQNHEIRRHLREYVFIEARKESTSCRDGTNVARLRRECEFRPRRSRRPGRQTVAFDSPALTAKTAMSSLTENAFSMVAATVATRFLFSCNPTPSDAFSSNLCLK